MKRKITLLDGAMGTNLLKMGMPSGICVEKWITEHKRDVMSLQKEYIKAGSKIIYAPTFGANPVTLGKYGVTDCAAMNGELVSISKEAAYSSGALIAGDISTTGLMPLPYGEASYDDYFNAFSKQAKALEEAGVDLFVIETSSLLYEVLAAVDAVRSVSDKEIFVSFTVGRTGKTFVGDDIKSCLVAVQARGASAFGVNCSEGEESVLDAIKSIYPLANIPLIAKPNAGVPDTSGKSDSFSSDPKTFALWAKKLAEAGALYIGGCCGTTPDHIAAVAKTLEEIGYEASVPCEKDCREYVCSANAVFAADEVTELPEKIPCDNELAFNLPSEGEADCCRILIEDPAQAVNLLEAGIAIELPVMLCGTYECIEAGIKSYSGRCMIDPDSDISDEEKEKLRSQYGCVFFDR